jgi:hypothetical protein
MIGGPVGGFPNRHIPAFEAAALAIKHHRNYIIGGIRCFTIDVSDA